MWPDDHAVFVALGQAMAASNGYQPMQASGLYTTDGDFVDWAYGRHRIFAFTFEMYPSASGGEGFYPPASVIAAQTARNRDAVLYLLETCRLPLRRDRQGRRALHRWARQPAALDVSAAVG